MMVVDCSELSAKDKLAVASAISAKLEGVAFALVKGDRIVLDELSDKKVAPSVVRDAINSFLSQRQDAGNYSTEMDGERIIIHSSKPVTARERRQQNLLPPNLKQCPFCPFITEYDELYVVHVRAHQVGF